MIAWVLVITKHWTVTKSPSFIWKHHLYATFNIADSVLYVVVVGSIVIHMDVALLTLLDGRAEIFTRTRSAVGHNNDSYWCR